MKKKRGKKCQIEKMHVEHPKNNPAIERKALQKIQQLGIQASPQNQLTANISKLVASRCGLRDENLAATIVDQLRCSLRGSSVFLEGEGALETALTTMLEMEPKNIVEALLAVQMMGIHNAALLSLQKAAFQQGCGRPDADTGFATATRLMRLFNEQVEVMAKLKGRVGQQKVTVEHVHVHDGGQAIVGAVNATGSKRGGGGLE